MPNEYPRMLYLGGDARAKHRIVANPEEERAAGAAGFLRAGSKAAPEPEPQSAPVPKKAPKGKKGRA